MKTFLSLFFVATCLHGLAQMPDYYVFLVKGEAMVSKQGVKPALLKQQHFIYKDQAITLKNGAELTIVDKDQNFYVLRLPGTYKARELKKLVSVNTPGITQKYLKLVWNELFNPHHDFSKFTKENIAGVYGGVSRGDECNNLIFPVNNLRTSEDSLHFRWRNTSPVSGYSFIVYNSERKEVVNVPVRDTQLTISLARSLNSIPGNYYWIIRGEKLGCEDEVPVYFEWMSIENEKKIISSILIENRGQDLSSQFQAIDKLEKNTLIPAAIKYYSSLVDANPGNEALVKSYIAFLLKYSLEEEANFSWQKFLTKK